MTTSLQKKLMSIVIVIEILTMKYKDKKALKRKFDCGVIRINPDKHDFNIFKVMNKTHSHIKKSSKNNLDKVSNVSSELEFKSNYSK